MLLTDCISQHIGAKECCPKKDAADDKHGIAIRQRR